MEFASFAGLFSKALSSRAQLIADLSAENTNAYRLFHGVSEGWPGLTIDRYGSLILVQTFRDPLSGEALDALEQTLRTQIFYAFSLVYNHRGKQPAQTFDQWHKPEAGALKAVECHEFGNRFLIQPRHPGIDPWLFLDLRAGRRLLREISKGASVLNLFSYTCSAGVVAAVSGASEVWNVDFSASHLEIGRKNAELNEIDASVFRLIEEDCLPAMRQMAGLPAGGRRSQKRVFKILPRRQFDIVFLDPPAWSKGPFGAIDVVGDYPSLFKPALLATKPGGGKIIATHHVASVSIAQWLEILKRTADKAEVQLKTIQVLNPESDFPSFDGKHPLKIAVGEIA